MNQHNEAQQAQMEQQAERSAQKAASRRKFLTRASAGLVVASLPARSVWASSGGVAQSIVASGHGSDFAKGDQIALLSPGYWKNHCEAEYHSWVFYSIFKGLAFDKDGFATLPADTTFGQILTEKGAEFKGISTVNFHMVAMYLNALNDGKYGLNYPIVGTGKPFEDIDAFAEYLYGKASSDAAGLGSELASIIADYHVSGLPYDDGSGSDVCGTSSGKPEHPKKK